MRPTGSEARGGCRSRRDEGSAMVEFLTLGVLLMVPLVYLVLTMARLQAASYAVDGSVREAARAFTTAPTAEEGWERAGTAVRLGLGDQGFDVEPTDVLTLDCDSDPCLSPGARVVARVEVAVVLPGVPRFVSGAVPLAVTVRSSQTAVVDEFRPIGPT